MKIPRCLLLWALAGFLILPPGCIESPQKQEELKKEIQALRTEVNALKEKLMALEAGQQLLLTFVKKPEPPPPTLPPVAPPVEEKPDSRPEPLTVSALLKEKDKYLGMRVTVRGEVGPVLVHRKSLLLKGPEGMVEVSFANLPDKKQVDRLTTQSFAQPLTVTGSVTQAKQGAAALQIIADQIDY